MNPNVMGMEWYGVAVIVSAIVGGTAIGMVPVQFKEIFVMDMEFSMDVAVGVMPDGVVELVMIM